MALMKCDKNPERLLLTHRLLRIGLVINHVVLHWVRWLWRHRSAGCPVCQPALLGRDVPGRQRETSREKAYESGEQTEVGLTKRWEKSRLVGVSLGLTAVLCLEAPLCSEMRMAPCTWANPGGAWGSGRACAESTPPCSPPSSSPQAAPEIYLAMRQQRQCKSNPPPINYLSHSPL